MIEMKTRAELLSESLEDAARNAVVTNLNPGARARILLDIFITRLSDAYETIQFNAAMGFVSSASGYFLDLIGSLVGVQRRAATVAVITREDRNLKFYVTSGKLVDLLPGKVIPGGTRVTDTNSSLVFTTDLDEPFGDLDTEVYVGAVANSPGSEYQVGRNILTGHNLGISSLLVTNERAVTNGSDTEGDDNYRYRIINSRAVREAANMTAVRIAMLPVPGVSDIVIKESAGQMEALVIPSSNFVTEATLRACEYLGYQAKAAGVRLVTRGPGMVPYEFYVQIQPTSSTPASAYTQLRQRVRQAVLDYMDDIQLGGTMILRQLQARIQNADTRVHDHRVICFNARRRPQLIRNFQLRRDELFVPDTQVQNPVLVTIA